MDSEYKDDDDDTILAKHVSMHLQHNPTQSLEGTKDSGGVDHETLDMLTADLEIITPLVMSSRIRCTETHLDEFLYYWYSTSTADNFKSANLGTRDSPLEFIDGRGEVSRSGRAMGGEQSSCCSSNLDVLSEEITRAGSKATGTFTVPLLHPEGISYFILSQQSPL